MKKILIHALGANMGGAMRHLTNFLPELARQDTKREYVVVLRESFPKLTFKENIHHVTMQDDRASRWLARIMNDVVRIPRD